MYLDASRSYFTRLGSAFSRLMDNGAGLERMEYGISAVVEDYQTRYLLPCK